MITTATQKDHPALVKLFQQARCTSGFGNILYSGPRAYESGWIVKAVAPGDELAGAYCVRQCTRKPQTTLYFITVDEAYRGSGIADELMLHMMHNSPHGRIVLGVLLENERARAFYRRHKFVETGPCYDGKGVTMEWTLL